MLNSNQVLRLAKILLHPLKLYENSIHTLIYFIIFTLFSLIGTLGNISGFLNVTGTVNKLEALVGLTYQLNVFILFTQVLKSRSKLLVLFLKLEKKQETLDPIPSRAEVFVRIKLIWFSIALGISAIVYISSSLFSYFTEDEISDKRSLLVPFWFSCGEGDQQTIFCWKTATKNDLLAKNTLLLLISVVQVFSFISAFTSYGIAVGELEMHLQNITRRVDEFNEKAQRVEVTAIQEANLIFGRESGRVEDEKEFHRQFLQIVKHQQFLYNCIKQMVNAWKMYVSYFYVSTFVDVTLFLFVADMERRNEPLLALRAITWGQMRILTAFIVAHCSQNMSHLNQDFSTQLIKILWYERDIGFQKLYLRMLSFHQNTNVMKIYGIVELNFNFFASMLRNMYSFVNLMILRYRK